MLAIGHAKCAVIDKSAVLPRGASVRPALARLRVLVIAPFRLRLPARSASMNVCLSASAVIPFRWVYSTHELSNFINGAAPECNCCESDRSVHCCDQRRAVVFGVFVPFLRL
jgi:hypothetical protein